MMEKFKNNIGKTFFISLVLIISILLKFYFNNKIVAGDEMSAVLAIFEHTKTICIGRFLIDVPMSAEVVYGPTDVGLSIERYPGKSAELKVILSDRLKEIEKDRKFALYNLREKESLIGTVMDGRSIGQVIVFGVSKGNGAFYKIESYITVGEDLFVQQSKAYGENNEYEEVVAKMNQLAPLIESRSEQEIPSRPGICIDHGFVNAAEGLEYENLSLGVRFAEFPDVHFSLRTSKLSTISKSNEIEPRLKKAKEIAQRSGDTAWYSRIRTLRQGARTIENWMGFEILARKPAQASERESHEFVFLSQGEAQNPLIPLLDLKLHSGVKDNVVGRITPSVKDEEAIVLWDRLTSSIREWSPSVPHSQLKSRGAVAN